MLVDPATRLVSDHDTGQLKKLYSRAFPDEDLLPLLGDLLAVPHGVFGLLAEIKDEIVGHIAFTRCSVAGQDDVYLLGPLAVAPRFQKQGIGSALIAAGVEQLRLRQCGVVYVLGDPAYYGRSGFKEETGVSPPYPLPLQWAGAWQSLIFLARASDYSGNLSVPDVWARRALWQP